MKSSREIRIDNIEVFNGVEYRVVSGYQRYLVSEYGFIVKKDGSGFVKAYSNPSGYKTCRLRNNKGVSVVWFVHRFVAMAWLDNSKRKPTVNHIDGNKSNNIVANLEWSTMKEQIQHALDNNLIVRKSGPEHHNYGKTFSSSTKHKMAQAKIGEKHPRFKGYYVTPKGAFASLEQASHTYNMTKVGFYKKFNKMTQNNITGWKFNKI